MAGERSSLGADAFHQVAVARQDVGAMIDDRLVAVVDRAEVRLGHRHPDRVREALAERAGRGLDAGRVMVLRVSGRAAAQLPERAQIVQRQIVPGEMEQRVE
jgi:hypothetical protein